MIKEITHFYCDYCGKEVKKKHICIKDVGSFGWVKPPHWGFSVNCFSNIYQFCNLVCFASFISSGESEAKEKLKKVAKKLPKGKKK